MASVSNHPAYHGWPPHPTVYMVYRPVRDVLAMVENAGYEILFQEVLASPANASRATGI